MDLKGLSIILFDLFNNVKGQNVCNRNLRIVRDFDNGIELSNFK